MKTLEYKSLYVFLKEKVNKFKFLIFISIWLKVNNQKVNITLFIFTCIIGLWSLEYAFNFFFYEGILSEDYSILKFGESSSQEPSGQNFNSGENSSHNNSKFFDTVLNSNTNTDTDRLANYLVRHQNDIYVGRAGIKFSTAPDSRISFFNEEYSRIARFVKSYHNGVFDRGSPQNTWITDDLLSKIKNIKENVPYDFT